MKIMVIDDEPEICDILAYFIRRTGFEVQTFDKPQDALDQMEEYAPAVVVCDFKMPHMTGLDFYKQIQKTWSGNFIILTGEPNTNSKELYDLGIQEVLFKPRDLALIPNLLKKISLSE